MIAERHRIGARIDEVLIDRFGNAEPARRVLAIDDDEIQRPVANKAGQTLRDRGASGLADDITDKKNSQLNNS